MRACKHGRLPPPPIPSADPLVVAAKLASDKGLEARKYKKSKTLTLPPPPAPPTEPPVEPPVEGEHPQAKQVVARFISTGDLVSDMGKLSTLGSNLAGRRSGIIENVPIEVIRKLTEANPRLVLDLQSKGITFHPKDLTATINTPDTFMMRLKAMGDEFKDMPDRAKELIENITTLPQDTVGVFKWLWSKLKRTDSGRLEEETKNLPSDIKAILDDTYKAVEDVPKAVIDSWRGTFDPNDLVGAVRKLEGQVISLRNRGKIGVIDNVPPELFSFLETPEYRKLISEWQSAGITLREATPAEKPDKEKPSENIPIPTSYEEALKVLPMLSTMDSVQAAAHPAFIIASMFIEANLKTQQAGIPDIKGRTEADLQQERAIARGLVSGPTGLEEPTLEAKKMEAELTGTFGGEPTLDNQRLILAQQIASFDEDIKNAELTGNYGGVRTLLGLKHDAEMKRAELLNKLDIAGVTGEFNAKPTIEGRKQNLLESQLAQEYSAETAKLIGVFNKQPTLAATRQASDIAIAEATLTGLFNNKETLAREDFMFTRRLKEAELSGQLDGQDTLAARRLAVEKDIQTTRNDLERDRVDTEKAVASNNDLIANARLDFEKAIENKKVDEIIAARESRDKLEENKLALDKQQAGIQLLLSITANPVHVFMLSRLGLLGELEKISGISLNMPEIPSMTGGRIPTTQEMARMSPTGRAFALAEVSLMSGLSAEELTEVIRRQAPGSFAGQPLFVGGR